MSFIEELTQKHPVRKTAAQKAAFREWVKEQCAHLEYACTADEKGFSRNVIIGEPEKARIIFTAHYDTPPRLLFPNVCTPKNRLLYVLMQVAMTAALVAGAALIGGIAGLLTGQFTIGFWTGDIALLALCVLLVAGPANPHCVNDNSSGVAAVLEIMARLPEEVRGKAAFLLFDNEEKGLLGSAAYAKKHPAVRKHRMVINMDCVGDGENILFLAGKAVRNLPAYGKLKTVLEHRADRKLSMEDMEKCIYPSDQASFRLGMAVCACSQTKKGVHYFARIHTPADTVCDQGNLDCIADSMAEFMASL